MTGRKKDRLIPCKLIKTDGDHISAKIPETMLIELLDRLSNKEKETVWFTDDEYVEIEGICFFSKQPKHSLLIISM